MALASLARVAGWLLYHRREQQSQHHHHHCHRHHGHDGGDHVDAACQLKICRRRERSIQSTLHLKLTVNSES